MRRGHLAAGLAVFGALLEAGPLLAHVMSMSNGDITITGNRAHYILRMPLYEIAHVSNPQTALFEHIVFSSGGRAASLTAKSCQEDAANAVYICHADYEFASTPEIVDVECTFHSVTVPNHVHLLRAEREGKRDQAIFDFSFTKATMRFRPPTAFETFATQSGAGFARALGGAVQVLFLGALVLAARTRRELLALTGMFVLGQVGSALIVPHTGWQPAARFVEAAMALTIAYLAVEILMLPKAGARWLIAGVLGFFHGLYFELFLRTTEYRPPYVLSGAVLAELLVIAVFAFAFSRIGRVISALRPVQVSASLLLAFGMVWFFVRLRG